MNTKGSEKKHLSDPTYDAADFVVQLTGGSLRWLASILAVLSLGLFVFLIFNGKEPEIYYPVHLKGKVVLWMVVLSFAVWLLLSIWNWRSWLKSKRTKG